MTDDPLVALESGWRRELPDLDTSVMLTVARVNRAAGLLRRRLDNELVELGTSLAELDVLSALRRAGPPYEMTPSALARAALLSPSGMTHRVDQLVASGLVVRVSDPASRRTAPVRLTEEGLAESERQIRGLVETEGRMLAGLSSAEREHLDRSLAALLVALADTVTGDRA